MTTAPDPAHVALIGRLTIPWQTVNGRRQPDLGALTVDDGRPLTDDEHRTLGECTAEEWRAAGPILRSHRERAAARLRWLDELAVITDRSTSRPDHPAVAGLSTEDADRAAQLTLLLSRPGDGAPR